MKISSSIFNGQEIKLQPLLECREEGVNGDGWKLLKEQYIIFLVGFTALCGPSPP
jgi:hypothetical protein